ncbi:LapA family protein [Pseudanabaena yagii]|uniref:DUF1049 domain-containing protein n=1 Tax=Pseudanabaena yagii GIHE-NHR1 TaxID=2722753 RepID=A0ABX1LRY7_9CYAN|nr:lipopolysaccharide assembly protein LapA domain-containing protein [Pseudanabaena yagii]NMF57569.1 DUF1049 domain-containing protein [Pseudanabaena yagii GIHE-NHR1]
MLRLLLYFCLWIGSVGLAIFASQNIYPVTVKLGTFESIKLPLGLVLIFCTGAGSITMSLFMEFSQNSLQVSFSSLPKFTVPNTKPSFQKRQTEPQKTSSKNSFVNPSTKKKQGFRDDFDDDWDDDWG